MKLQELTLKNINSFGNKVQTLTFDDKSQLVLLYGDNGVGKTTVSDALSLSLYGSVAKRKLSKIPNRFNKGLEVGAKFLTAENIPVSITRGLAPRKYNLLVDDVPENTSIDDVNDKLENELIRIPYNVFTNSVLLRLSEFESFVKMKVDKKRKIVDKIFESDIVNNMFAEFKEMRKSTSDEVTEIVKSRDNYEAKIESSETILTDLRNNINIEGFDFEAKTKKQKTKSTEYDKFKSDLEKLGSDWDARVLELNKNLTSCDNQIQGLSDSHTFSLNNINEEFNGYFNKYTSDIYNTVKSEYIEEIVNINNFFTESNEKLLNKQTELELEKTKLVKKYETEYSKKYIDLKQSETDRINDDIKKLQQQLTNLQLELQKIETLIQQANDANTSFNNQLSALGVNIENVNNKIALFEKGSCPECESDLNDHKGHAKLEDYKKTLTEYNLTITNSNQSILANKSIIETETPKKLALEQQIQDVNNSILKLQQELNGLDILIKNTLSDYHLTESKKIEDVISSKMNEFKSVFDNDTKLKNSRLQEINELIRVLVATKTDEFKIKNEDNRKVALDAERTKYSTALEAAKKNKEIWTKTKNDEESVYKSKNVELLDKKSNLFIELDTINKEIERFNKDTQLLNDAEAKIDKLQEELNKLEAQLVEHTEMQSIHDILTTLLGEDGIKQQIIKHSLPSFNQSIDYFRNYLEYPYYFTFDENFDVAISQYSYEIDPSELSMGETRLMDLIIILSVFDLILTKKNNLNVIFLDEIFTSLSKRNIAKVTHLLKEYSQKYDINIIIVSHTEVPLEYFDKVYELYKDGDFSDMKELK